MNNGPYHNQGFGIAFLWIIIVMFILPVMAMMTLDDTWDRFIKKYRTRGKVIVGKIANMKEFV